MGERDDGAGPPRQIACDLLTASGISCGTDADVAAVYEGAPGPPRASAITADKSERSRRGTPRDAAILRAAWRKMGLQLQLRRPRLVVERVRCDADERADAHHRATRDDGHTIFVRPEDRGRFAAVYERRRRPAVSAPDGLGQGSYVDGPRRSFGRRRADVHGARPRAPGMIRSGGALRSALLRAAPSSS